MGQIVESGGFVVMVEIYHIHMFRLSTVSWVKIQNNSRSNQAIKGHQRSNLGQTFQKELNRAVWLQLVTVYIYFDSEFGQEFKFKII